MSPKQRFEPKDIGAELFPAITSGLYRDPLDALREYIQNAIDAKAGRVEITLSKDVVSIRDNGTGMTSDGAGRAIRLGISEKNPLDNVGFRGIGIYSGFEICDRLEINTRPQVGMASVIRIDFGEIRRMLADENEKRTQREASRLHLEKMLSEVIEVDDEPQSPLTRPGTVVQMLGIQAGVAKRLSDTGEVMKYLRDTVRLPFNPQFKFAPLIMDKFKEEEERLITTVLKIGGDQREVFRPYTDDMFSHGGTFEPKFLPITSPNTKRKYGFVWVCINDARRVLRDKDLRGLLIKKYGFSIANRSYVESFFGRTQIARRITGEIVVQWPDLIPNAARTDFEDNESRADFQFALTKVLSNIDAWGNGIQNELKALEELDEIAPQVFEIHKTLPQSRRDIDDLLRLNVELAGLKKRLVTHRTVLSKKKSHLYDRTLKVLSEAETAIKDLLTERGRSKAQELARRAAQREREAPSEEETAHREDRPRTLLQVFELLDLAVTDAIRTAIVYIDESMLKPHLTEDQYATELEGLREHLEDSA